MEAKKKLNLGCGTYIRAGWINLDSVSLPGVDVIHNIEKLPLPFPDNACDEILCHDILEHASEYIPLLADLHRILKTGGTLEIRVPHFTSKTNFIDPTHRRMFSVNTFDFFIKNSRLKIKRGYIVDTIFTSIKSRRITFEHSSRLLFYNRIIAQIVNRSPRMQELYESTCLSRIFPAYNIEITLVK